MMDATDVFSGVTAFLLLAVVGCLLLLVTCNHRSGLRGQCILFLCAFAIRFLLSVSIYGSELHTVVVGDGDDNGWAVGLSIIADWEYRGLGPLDIPIRAYAPLFQGLRTTFSCVFEGFSRELSSHYIINTNCNALYSPIHYRKVANM